MRAVEQREFLRAWRNHALLRILHSQIVQTRKLSIARQRKSGVETQEISIAPTFISQHSIYEPTGGQNVVEQQVGFALERDRMYVIFTLIVLAILLFSLLGSGIGV